MVKFLLILLKLKILTLQLDPDVKKMLELKAKIQDNATTCAYNSRNAEL